MKGVIIVILCPKCNNELEVTAIVQCKCGYMIPTVNNIIQLTDLPDIVLDSDGDNYIGYEHIGAFYSNYNVNFELSTEDIIKANFIEKEIHKNKNEGTLLDIGCGDGLYTIPLLSVGVNVIAGDISNKMMGILYEKALNLGIDTAKLKLCRMNALCIPLMDECIDGVIANSMLHLNSNPQKIVNEISRVLKKGGKYFCFEDHPGTSNVNEQFDNDEYIKRVNAFHHIYWSVLSKNGIKGTRYSWNFDRDMMCSNLFTTKKQVIITLPHKEIYSPLSVWINRMSVKGFSNESAVPDDLHKIAFEKAVSEMKTLYGVDYDSIFHKGLQNDVSMTVYIK